MAAAPSDQRDDLFEQIGALLFAQGLSVDPVNYAFAHGLLSRTDPDARALITRLLDDGIRLSRREIAALGGAVAAGTATPQRADDPRDDAADRLVTETRRQAEAIATMARTIHDETRGFGRDLAESAAAVGGGSNIGQVAQLTQAMIARVAATEARLASATKEAESLRAELAEAQETARRDPLTGLANRRALAEAWDELATDTAHCVALCDIDRFKLINDRFGHLVGDRVLAAVATWLSTGCAGRLVTRQGGEEFAVLFVDTRVDEALAVLESTRVGVADRRLRDRESDAPIGQVTFSGGVVEIRPGESADDALQRADRLLYAAKAQGRNLVLAG